MNGGLKVWKDAGFETETTVNTPKEATSFGVNIPAHPEYDISRVKDFAEKVKNEGLKIVIISSLD